MTTISKIMDQVQGHVTGLLDDYCGEMDDAYMRMEGNLNVAVSVVFKPSAASGNALDADIGISFKKDEVKDKNKCTFYESDGPLLEHMSDEEARRREILFRDFRPFAATLVINQPYFEAPVNVILFKRFARAA